MHAGKEQQQKPEHKTNAPGKKGEKKTYLAIKYYGLLFVLYFLG